jgi:hypothetical protein
VAAHPTHATTKLVAIVVRHIFSQVRRTRNATPRVVCVEKRISYLWASLPVNGAHATTRLQDNTLPRRSVIANVSAHSPIQVLSASLVGKVDTDDTEPSMQTALTPSTTSIIRKSSPSKPHTPTSIRWCCQPALGIRGCAAGAPILSRRAILRLPRELTTLESSANIQFIRLSQPVPLGHQPESTRSASSSSPPR